MNEKEGLENDIQKSNINILKLDKEKDKYGMQLSVANSKYFHSKEEIKLKENLISEFQKKNIETEAKLK